MEDVIFTCLVCRACFHKAKHECSLFCTPKKEGVTHYDFCSKCTRMQMRHFEGQFVRKSLPLPKLRVEEADDMA